jgi:hypothetical protein
MLCALWEGFMDDAVKYLSGMTFPISNRLFRILGYTRFQTDDADAAKIMKTLETAPPLVRLAVIKRLADGVGPTA